MIFSRCLPYLGTSLTPLFVPNGFTSQHYQQLDAADNLRIDRIQATAISQPMPDSLNSLWEKIQRRAELNEDGSISWDEIKEATGAKPPLTKDSFDAVVAGEPRLKKEGLVKLMEAQSNV